MSKGITMSARGIFLGIGLFTAILGPIVVLGASNTKSIYVDEDNKGKEDGSRDHPYRKIGTAIKHVKGSTNIYVGKGHYSENITLPKDTKLIGGKDKGDVVIESKNNDKPTITMKDDTEINKITVKGGRHGVRVEENAEARIVKSVIKGSKRDGIHIDHGTLAKKDQVVIDKSEIKDNKMAGIFSEKRHVIVVNTDILRNGDGIDFTAGVKGWFDESRINDNRGSGAKFVLDDSSIWGKNNQIRRNGREGVEVNSYGAAGTVGLKKTKIVDNKRFGVTRLARTPAGAKMFGNLFLENNTNWGNASGNLSPILTAY